MAALLSTLATPAQGLGYLGLALTLSFGAVTSDRWMRVLGVVASSVWAGHFYLLGAHLSAGLSLMISLAMASLALAPAHRPRLRGGLAAGFALCYLGLTLAGWSGWLSLLPLVAALLSTYAAGLMNGVGARQVLVLSDLCWLGVAVMAGSIGGIVAGVLSIGLKALTVLRLRRRNAREQIPVPATVLLGTPVPPP